MLVIGLIACDCKRKFISSSWSRIDPELQCTDICVNQECDNMVFNAIDSNHEDWYSDDNDDDDDDDDDDEDNYF